MSNWFYWPKTERKELLLHWLYSIERKYAFLTHSLAIEYKLHYQGAIHGVALIAHGSYSSWLMRPHLPKAHEKQVNGKRNVSKFKTGGKHVRGIIEFHCTRAKRNHWGNKRVRVRERKKEKERERKRKREKESPLFLSPFMYRVILCSLV